MTNLGGEPPRGPLVAVAADAHPDLDDWVRDQAQAEADRSGWVLGAYLGREDILGDFRAPDMCCHIFAAARVREPADEI